MYSPLLTLNPASSSDNFFFGSDFELYSLTSPVINYDALGDGCPSIAETISISSASTASPTMVAATPPLTAMTAQSSGTEAEDETPESDYRSRASRGGNSTCTPGSTPPIKRAIQTKRRRPRNRMQLERCKEHSMRSRARKRNEKAALDALVMAKTREAEELAVQIKALRAEAHYLREYMVNSILTSPDESSSPVCPSALAKLFPCPWTAVAPHMSQDDFMLLQTPTMPSPPFSQLQLAKLD